MVRLIQMHKDAGHRDYVRVDMSRVLEKAKILNPTDQPQVPAEVRDMLDVADDEKLDDDTDKAATPAERIYKETNFVRELERSRPMILVSQRDSDAQKDVAASRVNALGAVTTLDLRTSSNLLQQLDRIYTSRLFLDFTLSSGRARFPWNCT